MRYVYVNNGVLSFHVLFLQVGLVTWEPEGARSSISSLECGLVWEVPVNILDTAEVPLSI